MKTKLLASLLLILFISACSTEQTFQPSNSNVISTAIPTATPSQSYSNGLSNGLSNSVIQTVFITNQVATNGNVPTVANSKPVSTYSKTDWVTVLMLLSSSVRKGDVILVKVDAIDAPGFNPSQLIGGDSYSTTIDQEYPNGLESDGGFAPINEWFTGSYKVEVFFNGNLYKTINFTVQ